MVLRRNIYKGVYLQRGSGFGTVLSGLFRFLVPFLKRGGKAALKSPAIRRALSSAKKSAVNVAGTAAMDVLKGKNPVPNAKVNVKTAKRNITQAILASPKKRQKKARATFATKQKKKPTTTSLI